MAIKASQLSHLVHMKKLIIFQVWKKDTTAHNILRQCVLTNLCPTEGLSRAILTIHNFHPLYSKLHILTHF